MTHVFFTDRDLGKAFPAALRAAGLSVERHTDHFADNATDPEWLRVVGRQRWLALTHDRRIRYKTNERDAVMRAGVGLFVLVGQAPTLELAQNFVNSLGKVLEFLEINDPPFIAKIYRPVGDGVSNGLAGRVEMWVSRADWVPGR